MDAQAAVTAYYNEFDPYAAAWLRNLIREGLIASGDVDERSIVDVRPDDLKGYTQCHFFAGISGWSLALRMAGWADDRPVWTGSCPCQPFSAAGLQQGESDERHLWPDLRRLIAECGPPVVFGEQVASRLGRGWLSGVRADLEALGYGVGAADLCAAGVGAPHPRQRLWWVADAGYGAGARGDAGSDSAQGGGAGRLGHAGSEGLAERGSDGRLQREALEPHPGQAAFCAGDLGGLPHAGCTRLEEQRGRRVEPARLAPVGAEHWAGVWLPCADGKARRIEPGLEPLAHGVSGRVAVVRTRIEAGAEPVQETHWYNRVGAIRGFGNAIIPHVAAEFIRAYTER